MEYYFIAFACYLVLFVGAHLLSRKPQLKKFNGTVKYPLQGNSEMTVIKNHETFPETKSVA